MTDLRFIRDLILLLLLGVGAYVGWILLAWR